jgi:hypothetical protein
MNFHTKDTPALAHLCGPEPTHSHTPLPPSAAARRCHYHALRPTTNTTARCQPRPRPPPSAWPRRRRPPPSTWCHRPSPAPALASSEPRHRRPPPSTSSRCHRPGLAPPISVGQCLDRHSQTQTQRQTQMLSLSECRGRLGGATWFLLLLCPHGKRIGFRSGHSVIGNYIVDLFSFFNFIHDAHFSFFIVFQFLVRHQF